MSQGNRSVAVVAVAVALSVAGCGAAPSESGGPSSSPSSSSTTSPPLLSSRPTMSASFGGLEPGIAALPEPSCDLRPGRNLIERVAEVGSDAYASITTDVDIDNCRPKLETFKQNAAKAPGYCTTIASADDNVGYDLEVVPAPPLRQVIDQAGEAC